MLYLTFNDMPSGIFSSQVIDVVRMFKQDLGVRIRLVSFIPLRGFAANRKRIREEWPEAIVLPILFRLRNWRYHAFFLSMIVRRYRIRTAICRGVFACNLALMMREKQLLHKVCYDGRGAVFPEFKEYGMSEDERLTGQIYGMESRAVNGADCRIAVSEKLVAYWKGTYRFASSAYVVVPCTLGREMKPLSASALSSYGNFVRSELQFDSASVVFVYAGSVSAWQSFDLIKQFVENLLREHGHYRCLFLSPPHPAVEALMQSFPGLVRRRWTPHKAMQQYLSACDYGLLIREPSITNEVASPTKFAEYLASGLQVVVSPGVGDYSGFVEQHRCGIVLYHQEGKNRSYTKPDTREKQRMMDIAMQYFSKDSDRIRSVYRQLLHALK